MITIKAALTKARDTLLPVSSSAIIDAECLLTHLIATSRTFLYAHPEQPLTTTEWEAYHQLITHRSRGVPIAYLTGHREFWSLPLEVTKDTLIPRPETELLVELTLRLLKDTSSATVLDLGTGSGAIALALAHERPDWQLLGVDIHEETLHVARRNADQLGLTNVRFLRSDWFSALPITTKYHAIVANPPYIAADDPHLSEDSLPYEPQRALVSGATGLESLEKIIAEGYDYLRQDGLLIVEHGYQQCHDVQQRFQQHAYGNRQSFQDLAGHNRISSGWRKNTSS